MDLARLGEGSWAEGLKPQPSCVGPTNARTGWCLTGKDWVVSHWLTTEWLVFLFYVWLLGFCFKRIGYNL